MEIGSSNADTRWAPGVLVQPVLYCMTSPRCPVPHKRIPEFVTSSRTDDMDSSYPVRSPPCGKFLRRVAPKIEEGSQQTRRLVDWLVARSQNTQNPEADPLDSSESIRVGYCSPSERRTGQDSLRDKRNKKSKSLLQEQQSQSHRDERSNLRLDNCTDRLQDRTAADC